MAGDHGENLAPLQTEADHLAVGQRLAGPNTRWSMKFPRRVGPDTCAVRRLTELLRLPLESAETD